MNTDIKIPLGLALGKLVIKYMNQGLWVVRINNMFKLFYDKQSGLNYFAQYLLNEINKDRILGYNHDYNGNSNAYISKKTINQEGIEKIINLINQIQDRKPFLFNLKSIKSTQICEFEISLAPIIQEASQDQVF